MSTDRSRVHPWMEVTREMVTLGVDAHKRTHTIVAVDEAGRDADGFAGGSGLT